MTFVKNNSLKKKARSTIFFAFIFVSTLVSWGQERQPQQAQPTQPLSTDRSEASPERERSPREISNDILNEIESNSRDTNRLGELLTSLLDRLNPATMTLGTTLNAMAAQPQGAAQGSGNNPSLNPEILGSLLAYSQLIAFTGSMERLINQHFPDCVPETSPNLPASDAEALRITLFREECVRDSLHQSIDSILTAIRGIPQLLINLNTAKTIAIRLIQQQSQNQLTQPGSAPRRPSGSPNTIEARSLRLASSRLNLLIRYTEITISILRTQSGLLQGTLQQAVDADSHFIDEQRTYLQLLSSAPTGSTTPSTTTSDSELSSTQVLRDIREAAHRRRFTQLILDEFTPIFRTIRSLTANQMTTDERH